MKKFQVVLSILVSFVVLDTPISGKNYGEASALFSSSEMKPNSIFANKDSISNVQPPANKKFGTGINPMRSILNIGYELQLRGAISLFSIDRHAEISFPIQYILGKDGNLPYRVFYSEATYRRFPNGQQKGFYYSGGLRYAYLEGEMLDASAKLGSPMEHTGKIFMQNKIGIYAGIGYRHFTKRGLYWGGNIIVGTYFGRKTPYIATTEDIALNWILGCDLLEIGYAF